MPSLTQIDYVLAVDRHRHFGKAADACHVSQPTLSQQIQKLEDELGIILFDRVKKPILPTPEGERFIEQAKSVRREYQRLLHLAQKKSEGLSGEFRLAIIPTVATFLIPLFIEKFSEAYPQIELSIEELKTDDIVEELKEDRIDGAILSTPLHQNGLKEHPLYYEPLFLYLPEGHRLLKKNSLTAADIDPTQLWLLQDGNCFKNQVANFCSIAPEFDSVYSSIHFQSGSLDTLKNLVKTNKQGYTFIPSLMTLNMSDQEKANHLRSFKAPFPTREISFVYRRDHWKLEIISAIENCVISALPPEVSRERHKTHEVLEHC